MDSHRPDPRAVALSYLAPALFGVHSLLLPWVAVDVDGADELSSFWQVTDRSVFDESAVEGWWFGVVALCVLTAIVCVVRAALPDAGPSWLAAGVPVLLVVCAAAVPFSMQAAIGEASGDTEYTVMWGGPVTLVLAAVWAAGSCLVGVATTGHPVGGRGWSRPSGVSGWTERGL